LSDTLPELLDEDIMQGMWYLHDGAPPHYACEVTQWLNQNLKGDLDEMVQRFNRLDLWI
jgi:predicted unusual protein kinase regulating ubiquinone biosynthesis (AarF/ABC1/UbiB family)